MWEKTSMKTPAIIWPRMPYRAVILAAGFCAMLLNVPLGMATDVKGSAESSQDSAAALEAVLQGVRDSEALFQNLLFDYTEEVQNKLTGEQLAADKAHGKGKLYLKEEWGEYRVIRQGRKFYFKDVSKGDGGTGPWDFSKTLVYNGKRIRLVQTNKIRSEAGGHANLIGGEEPNVPYAMSPQKMVAWGTVLLSELLSGSGREPHLKGQDVIDGIPCVRILVKIPATDSEGRDRTERDVYWLAPDRHYLPVKLECFRNHWSSSYPYARMEASDWREIEPGIIIPFKAVKKNYWPEDLKRNKETLYMTSTVTIRQISLRPNFEDSLFEDLPIPDGLPVYVVENGKIVKSYVQGRDPSALTSSRSWLLWAFGIGAVVFLALAAWLVLRRQRRRKVP
jgi:hypothetical protein